MYIVEITESKVEHLADTVGKMLEYGSHAMECIEELRGGHGRIGERNDGGYGRPGRYGMREEDMRPDGYDRMGERYPRGRWEDEDPYMGERRGRSMTTGRYIRR